MARDRNFGVDTNGPSRFDVSKLAALKSMSGSPFSDDAVLPRSAPLGIGD